jgi:hypothetical protein
MLDASEADANTAAGLYSRPCAMAIATEGSTDD